MRRPDSFGPMTRSPSRATATIAAAIAATTIHCSSVSNPSSHMASPPRGQRPAHQEIHASAAPRPSPRPGWRPEYRKRPFRDFNDDTSVIQYTPCPRPAWTGSERRRRRRWWPRWRRGTCVSITRAPPGTRRACWRPRPAAGRGLRPNAPGSGGARAGLTTRRRRRPCWTAPTTSSRSARPTPPTDTPPALQVKLLRVLEDRVISRLGESTGRQVDFRIIAATNRDLRALVEAGAFGADLYERLAIVTIALPPLRGRLEDLPELAQRFVERFYAEETEAGPRVRGLRADTLRALAAYPWPGNVRELRNVVWETLVDKRAGDEIIPSDLPRRVLRPGATPPQASLIDRGAVARKLAARALNLKDEIAALQRAALAEALALTGGNAAEAARLLGAVGRGRAKDPGSTVRAMLRRLAR